MLYLSVHKILLKLENQDYQEASALMKTIPKEEDSNISIRKARLEMVKGNFEKAQLALDEFLYDFHIEPIQQDLIHCQDEMEFISRFVCVADSNNSKIQNIDEEKVLRNIHSQKKQVTWEEDVSNGSFCPACQQDPCMCSDPY
jgi:hypothetical protein